MALGIQELMKIGQMSMPKMEDTSTKNNVFDGMFQSALAMIDQTNQLQKQADQMGTDFALGKIENIHDVMIMQEKATVALQYTVQLKNGIMDAYNEIMRMQM